MTRRDVTFAAIMSAVALAVYIGVKVWLGGHWDWVTFVIWVLAALLFGFGIIYAKSFLIRMVDEMTEDGVTPSEGERRTGSVRVPNVILVRNPSRMLPLSLLLSMRITWDISIIAGRNPRTCNILQRIGVL